MAAIPFVPQVTLVSVAASTGVKEFWQHVGFQTALDPVTKDLIEKGRKFIAGKTTLAAVAKVR